MDSQGIPPTTPTGLTEQAGANRDAEEGEENKINVPPPMKLARYRTPILLQHLQLLEALWGHQCRQTTLSQQIGFGQGDGLTYLGQNIEGANNLEDDKAPSSPKEDQQLITMSQKSPNQGFDDEGQNRRKRRRRRYLRQDQLGLNAQG
ncbi:MAG: hypothetical protein EZS28_009001 [Streblomastix strix]|uniref:Uncharacterized protein n=1 Tax=Streblomastix strix TaxID=222440 RepID=A0A5J4WKX8_9EUKA|nr:MAG: hypothetical protein EZS28_009001 [Streblomastix strix]